MHYTLHLTNRCNMACKYCYVANCGQDMEPQTARATVERAAEGGKRLGLAFFGGEPLLCKDVIYETVSYAGHVARQKDVHFHCKVTTNGLLLDEEFLKFSRDNDVFIALSHDGVKKAHDLNRVDHQGVGTYDRLAPIARALLEARPYAPVMMTIDPSTVSDYAQGVEALYEMGFRYLICSLNYAGDWDEASLLELRRQYRKLARFYERLTRAEEKFYLSPFEVKISSHIQGEGYCDYRCELGKKQLSVGPGGQLYPCVQFVGETENEVGHVKTGIDEVRRLRLYIANEMEKDTCVDCAIKARCNHHCGCLNKQATGALHKVAPALCAHERILLPIADALAERLYKDRNGLFIQKQYNDLYPLLSLIEERTAMK